MAKPILSKDNFTFNDQQRAASFWTKINITANPDECWEWTWCVNDKGYGATTFQGWSYSSHRLAYFLHTGIYPMLFVLHSCDNPACCNPNHLREGTARDNTNDALERKRLAIGEGVGTSVLTTAQVLAIQELYGKQSSTVTGKQFNIHSTTVLNIWNNKTWRHIG